MTYDSIRSGSVALGAMELKRCYQRNMLIAEVSVIAAVSVVVVLLLVLADGVQANTPITTRIDTLVAWVLPPPLPIEVLDLTAVPAPTAMPPVVTAEVEAVADSLLNDLPDAILPSQDDLRRILDGKQGDTTGFGDGVVIAPVVADFVDPRESAYVFVATDQMPLIVSHPKLDYPDIANRAGIEGDVGLRVRIDAQGNVIDAFVEQESGANAGFEEAALRAALQTKWRPAMQNGNPVVVWVSYKLKFRLKGRN